MLCIFDDVLGVMSFLLNSERFYQCRAYDQDMTHN